MINDLIHDGFEFGYPLYYLHSASQGPLAILLEPSGIDGDCLFLFTDLHLAEEYSSKAHSSGQIAIASLVDEQMLLGFLSVHEDGGTCQYLEFDPVVGRKPKVMMKISTATKQLEPIVERNFPEA